MSLPKSLSPEDARLIALGRKVEALLASEEVAGRLREAIDRSEPGYLSSAGLFASTNAVLAWFREQLLGLAEAVPLPPPANIPEGREPGSLQIGGIEPDQPAEDLQARAEKEGSTAEAAVEAYDPLGRVDQAARILYLETALAEAIAAIERSCGAFRGKDYDVAMARWREVLRGRP